jgi:hypothetical protein
VQENGIRARDLARLGRQVDLLQELLQSAATGSVEVRAEQARASLFAGQAGVREWLLAVEQAAALAGFSCDPEITAGARHWEEDPKVQLVEVVLQMKATADSNLASSASVRFSDFLNELAKRLEWAEFTGLVLRGTGTGLVSGSIKLRLWVVVPAS